MVRGQEVHEWKKAEKRWYTQSSVFVECEIKVNIPCIVKSNQKSIYIISNK